MAERTTGITLDDQGAMRTLDALQAKAAQLEQTLQRLSGQLGTGAGQSTEFRSAARELAATQGAMASLSALQSSATPGNAQGAATVSQAVIGGAQAGARAFNQIDPRMGPSFVIQAAAQAGQQAGQQWTPAFNAQQFAATLAPAPSMIPPSPTMMQQMQAFMASPMGMQMRGGLMPIGASAGMMFGQGMDVSTRLTLQGGTDPMGMGRIAATLLGGMVGAGFGFATGNPLIGLGVGAGAASVFGHIGDWLTAPQQLRDESIIGMMPFRGISPGGRIPFTEQGQAIRFGAIAAGFRGADRLGPTEANVSQTWEMLAGGLAAGGIDPYQRASSGRVYSVPSSRMRGLSQSSDPFGGAIMMDATIENTIRTILLGGAGRERMGEMYARRLTNIFGKLNTEMAGELAQVFGTLPETGGNMADILSQFGPRATSLFLRTQTEEGIPSRSFGDLMHDSATIRGAQREARRGALQTRGSGAAMLSAHRSEMAAIEAVPGGSESLAYSEAFARSRDAERTAFEQEGVSEFDIPSARLEAAREIMAAMPYAPGNRMALGLQRIQLNRMQRGRLHSFLERRRASGSLSEAEELETTQRILGLEVSEARNIATLTEGMDEMLPALSAGRPAFGARLDSGQLAAMRLFQIGHPRRGQGAISGRQLQMQDEFVRSFGIDPRDISSRSMRGMIDQPALAGMSSSRIEGLLERILYALEGNGPIRSQRPGEAAGRLNGQLSGQERPKWDGYN